VDFNFYEASSQEQRAHAVDPQTVSFHGFLDSFLVQLKTLMDPLFFLRGGYGLVRFLFPPSFVVPFRNLFMDPFLSSSAASEVAMPDRAAGIESPP